MQVIYSVVFYEEKEGGYSVFVPDLNNVSTCGETLEEAMEMTKDLIAGVVLDKIEANEEVPKASKIEKITYKQVEEYLDIKDWDYVSKFKTYIEVDISDYAKKWNTKLVKKTVNIPNWINEKAEERNINFSKTLEEALMEKIM